LKRKYWIVLLFPIIALLFLIGWLAYWSGDNGNMRPLRTQYSDEEEDREALLLRIRSS
jgi:nitrogen fixation-related uncharacterized protein